MSKKKAKPYYDLNVMIFQDGDEFAYSVVQEFDVAGKDREVLVSGSAHTLEEALSVVSGTVKEVLR